MALQTRPFVLGTLCAATMLAFSGCGGDGGDGASTAPPSTSTPPSDDVTLTGQVTRNAALENALVCLDLNESNACDADEPASNTDPDGMYSLKATAPDAEDGRLIAVVGADTRDKSRPGTSLITGADYVMTRPGGSDGSINPLTTLVQAGMAAGMSESEARGNVVIQLGLESAAKIDNYQDDPLANDEHVEDTARWIAAYVSIALREGIPLQVGDQSANYPDEEQQLRELGWGDADNYYLQTSRRLAKLAGVTKFNYYDWRQGKRNGAQRPDSGAERLYATAYLTPDGWQACKRDSPANFTTTGNPTRAEFCGTSANIGFGSRSSIEGETLGDLISRWQNSGYNHIYGTGLAAHAGMKFGPGAQEIQRHNLQITSELISIDNVGTRFLSQATNFEEMITNYRASVADTAGSGNDLADATISLGFGSSLNKAMRAAFDTSPNSVKYYECDLDAGGDFVNPLNCQTYSGNYTIESKNGSRLMRFSGHPTVTSDIAYDVIYAEVTFPEQPTINYVYRAHQMRGHFNYRYATSMRLNNEAWNQLKGELKIDNLTPTP